jgi:CHAD domain-containing protein
MTTQTRQTVQATGSSAVAAPMSPDRRQSPQAVPGPETGRQPASERRGFTHHSPSGDVVLAYLETQAATLKALDPAVRRDAPDSVHQMRVAARRLRSTLRSYPAIVSSPATQHMGDELKWLGAMLGEARDNEVLSDYLRARVADLPPELVLGPARARVRAHFAPREASARNVLVDALNSSRYFTMLAELDRLLADPPLAAAAAEPASEVLPQAVARAYRRTRREVRRARRAATGPARDTALHEMRKAAKRARYAAEAAEPALGKEARHFAKRMKAVQSALGEQHDAVTARAVAREIGIRAHLAGENAFTFGLLQERADRDAAAQQDRAMRAWKSAARRKHRGWLDR